MTATATKTSLKKWICAASNFIALIPSRLIVWMLAIFFEADSKGLYQSSAKEKESCCLVFQSSTNREIRHFHVLVLQWRQRNEQKSLMGVQSCCFANLNLLFFCRSRWPRRSRCLSSLMIDSNPSACSCAWILRLCWHYPVQWEHHLRREGRHKSLTHIEHRAGAGGWPRGFGALKSSPHSWIFTSVQWVPVLAPTYSLPLLSNRCSHGSI